MIAPALYRQATTTLSVECRPAARLNPRMLQSLTVIEKEGPMKRFRLILQALIPAAWICLVAQGAAVNTTLTVNGSGTINGSTVTASGTLTLTGIGSGTMSSSFNLLSALSGSAPLTLTITTGNPTGTLTCTLTASPSLLSQIVIGDPNTTGPATLTVNSGTGGFAGTTGSFNLTASGTGIGTSTNGAGTFKLTGSGTLNIPNFSGGGGGGPGAPSITQVQNNYSYTLPGLPNYGIAPGALFIVKGSNLATNTTPVLQSSAAPGIPTTLNGTSLSVTVGGVTTTPGIYYTSTGQLAAVLPSNTPTGTGTLAVTTAGGTSQASIQVVQSAFGIDTYFGTGSGLAVATDANGNVFQNTKSASPGQAIVLWGSGVGADTTNDDKTFPLKQNNLTNIPMQVFIGGLPANIAYRGRSQYPGVDQVVVTVPQNVSTGCSVSVVVVSGSVTSNVATLPVNAGGGTCSDANSALGPGLIDSLSGKGTVRFGYVSVSQSTTQAAGTTQTSNVAGAAFYSEPGSVFAVSANGGTAPSLGSCVVLPTVAGASGPPPTGLDAGTITVNGGGTSATLQTTPIVPGVYFAQLSSIPPNGAAYAFTGSGGKDVGAFNTAVNFPPPLVWTNQSSVTSVNRSQGVTLTWSGGAAGTYVSITGSSSTNTPAGQVTVSFTCYAPVNAGQFTVPTWVLLSLPASNNGGLSLGNYTNPGTFTASGLDFAFTLGSSSASNAVSYQ
jgi:uncharacterized protein (TIGR03437 family)